MLTKPEKNELLKIIMSRNISLHRLSSPIEKHNLFQISLIERPFYFKIEPHSNPIDISYGVTSNPRTGLSDFVGFNWQGVVNNFKKWTGAIHADLTAPDLWAEAAKTAQLFTGSTEAADDKFTRSELAEVQGQLRQLQRSFAAAALPEAARQKLIELTENAAVKAEGMTKKDWQQMIIGGFVQAIIGLMLNPTQAGEVLKLVKAAFGGLFLP